MLITGACCAALLLSGCASGDSAPSNSTPAGEEQVSDQAAVPTPPGSEPFLTSGWEIERDVVSPFEDRIQVDPEETEVDSEGLALYRDPQTKEVQAHPIVNAQYAMAVLKRYEKTGDEKWLDHAIRNAEELIDTHVERDGAWFFQYDFDWTYIDRTLTAPWWSGMAQGEALTVFSKLAELQPERPEWREAADRTFDSFLLRGSGNRTPWVSVVIDGELWFEEYAGDQPPLQVLNGQIFALFGLYEYFLLTDDPLAARYIDGGSTTVLEAMPLIRVEGGVNYYCVQADFCQSPDWQNTVYHPIHIQQLNALHRITGDDRFTQWADLLEQDWQPDDE